MRYTVVWTPDAEKDLADIWVGADDRRLVTAAADSIEASLRDDPNLCGESRSASARVAFAFPLAVEFEVLENDRVVRVLAIWLVRGRSR